MERDAFVIAQLSDPHCGSPYFDGDLLERPDRPEILWLDALVAAAIIWLHRTNIRRLLNGTESRFGRRAAPPAHP